MIDLDWIDNDIELRDLEAAKISGYRELLPRVMELETYLIDALYTSDLPAEMHPVKRFYGNHKLKNVPELAMRIWKCFARAGMNKYIITVTSEINQVIPSVHYYWPIRPMDRSWWELLGPVQQRAIEEMISQKVLGYEPAPGRIQWKI